MRYPRFSLKGYILGGYGVPATVRFVFFVLFLLDVLIRIWVLRREWYFDSREGFMYLNVFDACVVFVNAFELLILPMSLAQLGFRV